MRSFQSVLAILFAFFTFALAQQSSPIAYDATVYVTSTVYRVNTVTLSSSPTAALANQTSTITGTGSVGTGVPVYPTGNATSVVAPTTAKPSQSQFTGAASSLNVNVFVAAIAAGVAYLAL